MVETIYENKLWFANEPDTRIKSVGRNGSEYLFKFQDTMVNQILPYKTVKFQIWRHFTANLKNKVDKIVVFLGLLMWALNEEIPASNG